MAKLDLNVRLSDYIEFEINKDYRAIDFTVACNPSLRVIGEPNHRGKKVEVCYRDRITNDLVVKKEFVENYEDKELEIVFYWYDRDEKVCATKTKVIDLSEAQWESRYRKQRERVIDDLKGRAKTYGADHYVDILYAYFKDEKQDFVETGSNLFATAVRETLSADTSGLPLSDKQEIETVKLILNNSLDGVNKIYETLIFLTTL